MDEQFTTRQAMSGDPDAIRRLWRANRRWVAAVLLAHMPARVELDDLLQDVAMTFVRKIHTLRDPGGFRPWLRTIAVNQARTAGRRGWRRPRMVGPPDSEILRGIVAPDPAADERLAAAEQAERLLQRARALPAEYREPLLLRCCHQMSYARIADLLDVPVTTVETRIARARRMLRESIDAETTEPQPSTRTTA